MNDTNDNKTQSISLSDIKMDMSDYNIENGLIYIHKHICINDCCRKNNTENVYHIEKNNKS